MKMDRDRFSIAKVEVPIGDMNPIVEEQVDASCNNMNGVAKGLSLRRFSRKNDDRKMSLAQLTK